MHWLHCDVEALQPHAIVQEICLFLFKVSFLTILSLFKGIMGQRKSLLWSIAFPLPIPLDLVHHTTRRTIFLALILTLCRQCWDLSQLERLLHLVIQWQEGQRLEVFMRIYRRFVRFINTEYASFKLFLSSHWLQGREVRNKRNHSEIQGLITIFISFLLYFPNLLTFKMQTFVVWFSHRPLVQAHTRWLIQMSTRTGNPSIPWMHVTLLQETTQENRGLGLILQKR